MVRCTGFVIGWLLLCMQVACAQQTLTYTDSSGVVPIGRFIRFLEDPHRQQTIHTLRRTPDRLFRLSPDSSPNFGAGRSVFWLKVTVHNQTGEPLFLLCDEENIFTCQLYVIDSTGRVNYRRTGFTEPYSSRFFENNQLTLPIGRKPQTLYIGISGNASLLASFYIASQQPLAAWQHLNDVSEGIFLGWMLLTFLYNLFIYVQLRDRLYLWYCLYVCTCTFLIIRLEGIGFDLLWRSKPWFNQWIDIPGIINTLVVVYFATQFLQTKAILPAHHRILTIFMGVVTLLIPLELFDIRPWSNNLVMLAFLTGAFLLFWTALTAYRRDFRQARFYLLGWTLFLLGTTLFTLWKLGILTINHFLIYNSFLISVMLEAALFSFALADRIRIYRQEAADAQALSMQRLEENEQLLLTHNRLLEEKLRLEQAGVQRPAHQDNVSGTVQRLAVPSMEGVLLLPVTDIVRIQALGSYCNIYLTNSKKIMASKPLAEFEPFLTGNDFLRVHKSHLINLNQVTRYVRGDGGTLIMNDGSEVSVSRSGKPTLLTRLQLA